MPLRSGRLALCYDLGANTDCLTTRMGPWAAVGAGVCESGEIVRDAFGDPRAAEARVGLVRL